MTVRHTPHRDQRYDTCGDWQVHYEHLYVDVSEMDDWREPFLVSIHEQVEAAICTHLGIDEQDISAFDIAYEKQRPDGDDSEPGDSLDAPYYHAHQIATQVERIAATALGVHWPSYEQHVLALDYPKKDD